MTFIDIMCMSDRSEEEHSHVGMRHPFLRHDRVQCVRVCVCVCVCQCAVYTITPKMDSLPTHAHGN